MNRHQRSIAVGPASGQSSSIKEVRSFSNRHPGETPLLSEVWSSTRGFEVLGWYEAVPATLDAVIAATSSRSAAIIDVGAGASTLADHLLDAGFGDVTLLDLSASALETTRLRLGATPAVTFLTGDVTSLASTRQWDLWHDRAVFHFLVDPEHRAGQPVAHYDEEALVEES